MHLFKLSQQYCIYDLKVISYIIILMFPTQLNQQSHSESEVKEDDNETEATKSWEGEREQHEMKRKKKKKKKKAGKPTNTHRSSEDNADVSNSL